MRLDYFPDLRREGFLVLRLAGGDQFVVQADRLPEIFLAQGSVGLIYQRLQRVQHRLVLRPDSDSAQKRQEGKKKCFHRFHHFYHLHSFYCLFLLH